MNDRKIGTLIDEHILSALQVRKERIVSCDPLSQEPIVHDRAKWQTALATNKMSKRAFDEAIEFLNNTLSITRKTLFDAITEGVSPHGRFLMQMMWGYPARDGRATSKVLGYFSSPELDYLEEAFAHAAEGEFCESYTKLCAISGLSTSYATKSLYFESRGSVKDYAVILDDRVCNGVLALSSSWGSFFLTVTAPRPSKLAKKSKKNFQTAYAKYEQYLKGCHEIARDLGCEADQVEYFLFNL